MHPSSHWTTIARAWSTRESIQLTLHDGLGRTTGSFRGLWSSTRSEDTSMRFQNWGDWGLQTLLTTRRSRSELLRTTLWAWTTSLLTSKSPERGCSYLPGTSQLSFLPRANPFRWCKELSREGKEVALCDPRGLPFGHRLDRRNFHHWSRRQLAEPGSIKFWPWSVTPDTFFALF